jgi:hypothetical protein
MVPGFNTDFKYRGETYHVQTEDNGIANPVVVTLLYHKGAILASRRTPYHDLVSKAGFEQELMGLMKAQHKDLMRALLAGAYDKDGAAPAAAGGSGEHPAVAAASVAGAPAKTAAKPAPAQAAPTSQRAASLAPGTSAPPSAPTTLDEAIRHYLAQFAQTAARTAH